MGLPLPSNRCLRFFGAAPPVPPCLDAQAFLALMSPDDPAIRRDKRAKFSHAHLNLKEVVINGESPIRYRCRYFRGSSPKRVGKFLALPEMVWVTGLSVIAPSET